MSVKVTKKSVVKSIPICALREWPCVEFKFLSLDQLMVDLKYQRKKYIRHISKIAEEFDPIYFGTIIVVKRGERYFVVDGQQRCEAARIVGYINVPCLVLKGTVKKEAEVYSQVNACRKSVTPLENFKAKLIAQNSQSLKIKNLAEKYGFEIGNVEGAIKCIAKVEEIVEEYSFSLLEVVLKFIKRTWSDDSTALSEMMIGGLAIFFNDPTCQGFDISKAKEKFINKTPLEFRHMATNLQLKLGKTSGHSRVECQAMAFRQYYRRRK